MHIDKENDLFCPLNSKELGLRLLQTGEEGEFLLLGLYLKFNNGVFLFF